MQGTQLSGWVGWRLVRGHGEVGAILMLYSSSPAVEPPRRLFTT